MRFDFWQWRPQNVSPCVKLLLAFLRSFPVKSIRFQIISFGFFKLFFLMFIDFKCETQKWEESVWLQNYPVLQGTRWVYCVHCTVSGSTWETHNRSHDPLSVDVSILKWQRNAWCDFSHLLSGLWTCSQRAAPPGDFQGCPGKKIAPLVQFEQPVWATFSLQRQHGCSPWMKHSCAPWSLTAARIAKWLLLLQMCQRMPGICSPCRLHVPLCLL